MDFYTILDQVVALLRQRGRVTYRALKRQFDLDEEALADLTAELRYAQYPVREEEGQGLVWIGDTGATPESTSTSPQAAPQPVSQDDHTAQGKRLAVEGHVPDAERRQLTVLFCDLVDSTSLSRQLDPEDYREVVRAYQQACAEVIQRFDGHIAQYLGDGLLVYFGYPQAHEDDAQRAIHAGLDMLDAMGTLNIRLEQEKGIRLAIRVGIHTGLTVVGEIGAGGKQEQLAMGETPNIAARIQGVAEPNTIAISDTTYRLTQGYFACDDRGFHALKGVAEPQQVYRVLRESGSQSRLDIAATRGLVPLVGRESEGTFLLERWEQTKERQGHVVFLTGEGGIGKSRLVQALKEHIVDHPHTRWECRSSPYYQNTALYPLTDFFQRALHWQQSDTPGTKLEKLEQELSRYRLPLEESVPLFASVLSIPIPEDRYPPLPWSPQRHRQKTLEAILAVLLELAEQQPLLFILEDLHWTDPSTLEFLDLLIDQIPTAAICTLLTCRPTYQPPWNSRSYLTQMTLNRLSRSHIERIAEQVAGGKSLPKEVLQQIVEKTDGVPLFVEEITKAVLESGYLKEVDGRYELTGVLPAFAIPVSLQDSLMARLDRLMTAKVIAQLGATIGRQFSYTLLQAVVYVEEDTLHQELSRLVEAELLYQHGLPPQATYIFKHALIQDTAYQSLLRSTRQQYHQRIAQVLAERFPETAETQPEVLAHHYTEASLHEQAVDYWLRAGQRAIQRSAHVEAIRHLTKGLEVLTTLPDTPERAQQELSLHLALGVPLIATKGFAAMEVEHAYTRARALCQQMGDTPQLFPALRGLRSFYNTRAEFQTSRTLSEQLLTMAQRQQDPTLLLGAHRALGSDLYWLGEFTQARVHLEQVIALYDRQQHYSLALLYGTAPRIHCLSYAALTLWLLGYPDQALTQIQDALTFAQELSHAFNLALALYFAAWFYCFRREISKVQEWLEAAVTLSSQQEFPYWLTAGTILRGWLLAERGREEDGIEQMRRGLVAFRATGAEQKRPYFLALIAEAYGKVGHAEEGLRLLVEAMTLVDKTGERWWEAELHRLKGELLLAQEGKSEEEAETSFQQALDVARRQQAKSLELRAALSLSRLWQQQGKRDEARELLAPVYRWFTEGFDTIDLQEAKALLEELR